MANTIITKNSSTASAVPTSGDLVQGELAVNVTDKRLFTENSGGTVVELGTNPSSLTLSGGTANGVLYLNGSKVATSGSALTFDGTNLGIGVTPVVKCQVDGSFGISSGGTYTGSLFTNSSALDLQAGSNSTNGLRLGSSIAAPIIFYTAGAEKMRIDSSGNVGVGTSSPITLLHLAAVNPTIYAKAATTGYPYALFSNDGGDFYIGRDASGGGAFGKAYANVIWGTGANATVFATNNTEVARIDSSGNVGIGNTSASSFNAAGLPLVVGSGSGNTGLTIYSGTAASGSIHFADGTTTTDSYRGIVSYSHTSNYMTFWTDAAERMRIDTSGNVGVGTSSPQSSAGYGSVTINGSTGGQLYFRTADSNVFRIISNTTAVRIGTGGSVPVTFETSNTERMRLDSSGNVGVGTSSPSSFSAKLVVNNGTNKNTTIRGAIRLAGSAIQSIQDNAATDSPLEIYTGSAQLQLEGNPITFYNGGERARIDSSGNLLVGKTATSATTVGCQLNAAGTAFFVQTSTGDGPLTQFVNINASTPDGYRFASFRWNTGGTEIGTISKNSASAVAYNTTSDYRLKQDIAPMTGALAKVQALKPVTYKWKLDGSDGQGFIAHELQEVCPDAVTGSKDAVDEEGNPRYQGIDTSFLVATLTAAIQEQQAIIESLTARIAALEAN